MRLVGRSLLVGLWFMFLTLPLLAVRVNTITETVEWRWLNLVWVGLGTFILSLALALWRQRSESQPQRDDGEGDITPRWRERLFHDQTVYRPLLIMALLATLLLPWLVDIYQINILVLALIFVVLGLGLNIIVGLAGLLDLGYIAFFAVGAYTYALLNINLDLGFWAALPLGGLAGAFFGLLIGFPVLRLRGDYLAIVTLGFGSIVKIVIENEDELFYGAMGIADIPRPGLLGLDLSLDQSTLYTYYLVVALALLAIFVTNRLKDSRLGRAWIALREDEIAAVAMGIDMAKCKLSAYAFGAFWAGLVGVLFAARNTFIHPNSFTFAESALVLSMVVLGGMGSIVGVTLAALILVLLPEYLQGLAEYRMLVFGGVMVAMMVFRPHGLISPSRRRYTRPQAQGEEG
ncbi:MAG: branched-chain amino acid ABC transporter permease [Desulfuromonas sp.]|nr:MAG: branched-chain amino acid ABC transporter permease [Desulfuromonas sp.]